MATIPPQPEDTQTVKAIYAWHESQREDKPRTYLGASQIGHECERSLWYSFRHCGGQEFDGRMLRLFETGDLAEFRFVAELKAIGAEVYDVDPATTEQWEVKALGGHFSGHMDGCASGIPEAPQAWHVLEFKTHNAKSFASLKSKGVKESKPLHYAQMIVYMKLTGMKRAMYLAVNKDTDALYTERLRWEDVQEDAARYMERAERIISASAPPAKIGDIADHFACRRCEHAERCHGTDEVGPAVRCPSGCRTCVHSTPEMDTERGRWSCAKHSVTLTIDNQAVGCEDHLYIPALVTFAEPVDTGRDDSGDWIEYKNADGTTWRNSKSDNNYASKELTQLPGPLVGAGLVDDVKSVLGGVVEGVRDAE